MKQFFRKYKKYGLAVILVVACLFIFTTIRLILAVNSVKATIDKQKSEITADNDFSKGWQNQEVRQTIKDIHWYEQQLLLAKSDSINLGINLADSVVQVQLKGTVLFQSRILLQKPAIFLNNLNPEFYLEFSKIASIKSETANTPKKPIKRVAAPNSIASQNETKNDTIIDQRLVWQFTTDNDVNVIITGVEMNKDSLLLPNSGNDLFNYHSQEFFGNIIPDTYSPTLYIWLNDKEAKAVYRALPEKGKVIIRN